jgi:Flp pilus assembly protein TadG
MWPRLYADRRGVAALEFAAVGSVLLILLFAIFDIGLLYLTQRGLDYGIYRAARWASVNSASLTTANVLAQFKIATSATLGSSSSSCLGYLAGTSVPAGTVCYITVAFSNGIAVGSVVTIQANYKWAPVSPMTGLVATTLQSNIGLTIQH